jgi:hypothetical protein
MNKYLKNANDNLNKNFSKLETKYFNIYESLAKAKVLKTDDLSRAFLRLSSDLEKFITVDSIKNYVKTVSPIISYEKLNTIMRGDKNIGIIVFDTETTGLIQKTAINKYGKLQTRNQIYELAAITYNYSLEEAKDNNRVDFFHAKVKDASLNAQNSVAKISDKVKKILKSDLDMEMLNKAYKMATQKNPYNPEYKIFADNLSAEYKEVAGVIIKMMPIEKLRKMTKADKEKFTNLWTGEEYMVDFYDSEMAMITNFFNYIEKQKTKFEEVYILAHNLNYDKGMILGAIEDSISYWQKGDTNQKEEVKKEMLAKSQALDVKARSFFAQSIDTLDGFKTLLNEKKYIDKIERLAKTLKIYKNKKDIPIGEKGFISKLIVRMTKIAKTKNNLYRSTSLGKISPKSINKDWHTALNDVFVTVKTTKIYFTLPMIISILIKISEEYEKNKTILKFSNIKIPIVLIKFAIKNKFHQIYSKIKQEVPEEYDGPFYAKNANRQVNPLKLNPDFAEKDDIKITKAETGKDGKDLIADLQVQKDFKMMTDIVNAHEKGQMNQLTKEINNRGINVSEKELQKIIHNGLPKIENLYDILKTKGFSLEEEYLKAKKMKQGSKYLADKIKKKFNMDVDKNQIIEILKQLGIKK